MIKSNELRFGNYVKHFENGIVLTVGRTVAFRTPTNTIRVDVDDLEPILLTEEWLLKFGFEKKSGWDDYEYYIKDEVEIIFNENVMFKNSIENQIEYVHQIQNIYFALTGNELTNK